MRSSPRRASSFPGSRGRTRSKCLFASAVSPPRQTPGKPERPGKPEACLPVPGVLLKDFLKRCHGSVVLARSHLGYPSVQLSPAFGLRQGRGEKGNGEQDGKVGPSPVSEERAPPLPGSACRLRPRTGHDGGNRYERSIDYGEDEKQEKEPATQQSQGIQGGDGQGPEQLHRGTHQLEQHEERIGKHTQSPVSR